MSIFRKVEKMPIVLSLALVFFVVSVLSVAVGESADSVSRVGGENRYETAAMIALDEYSTAEQVIIARGDEEGNFADGLAASVLAGVEDSPVLLVEPDSLPDNTVQAIEELGATKAVMLGGTNAISADVAEEIEEMDLEVKRVSGADRFETAARIAEEVADRGNMAEHAFIVNGTATADALVSGTAAFRDVAPILQVRHNDLPEVTEEVIGELGLERVYLVGGQAVISAELAENLEKVVEVETRLAGKDRYHTSVIVAEKMFADEEDLILSGGADGSLVDAIGASIYKLPILYVQSIPEVVEDYLDNVITANSQIKIIGGTSAVSDDVETSVSNKIEEAKEDDKDDDEELHVELQVEGINDTILPATEVALEDENGEPSALDALEQGLMDENIDYEFEHYDWGVMISSIDGEQGGTFGGSDGWMYEVNDESPEVGADAYILEDEDEILFYYNRWPEISTQAELSYGEEDPQIEVELIGDEFTEGAEELDNWEVDTGDTELALEDIQKQGDQEISMEFEGISSGRISIQAQKDSLGGDSASNTIEVNTDLSLAMDDAVSWYEENNNPPDTWKGMPGLWGAGENLNADPWETTQDWRDSNYEPEEGAHWQIHYIFKLLVAEKDPSSAWDGINLFQELSALQKDSGEFEDYTEAAQPWAVIALDVGAELGLDVGDWDESSRELAIDYLLEQQNPDGSFSMGIDATASYLTALSGYLDDEDVKDVVEDALDYLEDMQDEEAFFVGDEDFSVKNASTQALAISGLVSVGEDILDSRWIENGRTALDALLEFQEDDGQFWWTKDEPGAGTLSHDDALLALAGLKIGESIWHRTGKEAAVD